MRASRDDSNGRLPKNYALVREVVHQQGAGKHLTTADVHTLARRRRPAIGFTTVYRALNRLAELGLVSAVRVPGADTTYYEAAAGHHAHFRCTACGEVADLDYRLPPSVIAKIARTHGIDVSEALVNLAGHCAACRHPGPQGARRVRA